MQRTVSSLLIVGILAGAAFAGIFGWRAFEGTPPELTWVEPPKAIGQKAQLKLHVADSGTGVAHVTVAIEQAGTPPVTQTVLDEDVPLGTGGLAQKTYEKLVEFSPRDLNVRDGALKLTATARDRSRRNSGQGNVGTVMLELPVRLRPPTVEILSEQHNIEFGGSMMIAYRVGPSAIEDGVRVGDKRFRGYPSPADNQVRLSLFALSFREPTNVEPVVYARDEIGNENVVHFPHTVKPRTYPDVPIPLKPEWIEAVRQRFALPPGLDETAAFLEVNNKLRVQNHETLAKILAGKTEPQPLWSGALGRMMGKPVSRFAESRHYLWQEKEIDEQVHLGVDIAAHQNYPVPAAANGIVIHAGDLGIYGNCVIIDHGLGLATLYGHMSTIAVAVGDHVEKEKVIGVTGQTGLAFGDHLHFGIYVNGVAVDPKDWWDPLFIEKRLEPKLAIWRSGGAGVTAQPAAAAASSGSTTASETAEPKPRHPATAHHTKHGR